jgi:hypothetical protein
LLYSVTVNGDSGATFTLNQLGYSLSAQFETIGDNGSGIVNQWGGSNTVTSQLILGNPPGSLGTYNLRGGSLLANVINVGMFGNGAFNQIGTVTVDTYLYLGTREDSSGSYKMWGGSLTVGKDAYIGSWGSGDFTMVSGTLQVKVTSISEAFLDLAAPAPSPKPAALIRSLIPSPWPIFPAAAAPTP